MVFKKKKSDPEKLRIEEAKKKVQNWMPVIDIRNKLIVTASALVGVLRVHPLNINLKSENEKKRIIQSITGAFNSLQEPIQILCIPRAIDLDAYIRSLDKKAKEQANLSRRRLLNLYLSYVQDLVSSGEVNEKRFYILVSEEQGKYADQDIKQKISSLEEAFERAGLEIYQCNDKEITDLLFTFSNSDVSAFEREPDDLRKNVLYNWTINS